MISTNGKPVRTMLLGSVLVLAGAAAWILLNAGQAGALVNSDQDSTNTNVGVAVANTGGNVGVGNASTNNAKSNQKATATGGGSGDKIAINQANVSNHSDGSATIVTGDANATGNQASNNTVQSVDTHGAGGLVNVDQNSNNVNVGIAVANTGGNIGVGNASTNNAKSNQNATATGSGSGDKVASNVSDASNRSNGSATIVTGNAWATGNQASNNTVQTVDASGSHGLVLADQNSNNLNFGIGIANSGLNIGVGNGSTTQGNASQLATALGGGGDKIAVNDATASNSSDGDVLIHTGNANAVGNVASSNNTQWLDSDSVAAVRGGSATLPMTLLFFLVGLLFVGRPMRQSAIRRRT